MGTFIVFEGGEGAGKTTQARSLFRRLSRDGYQVVLTREPGGTDLGETIRRWLKGRSGLTPATELLLFVVARAQHVEEVISPALSSGQIVVCDRYTASTVAYQGHGRGMDPELIARLNQAATRGVSPDLTVYLDMPVEAGLARMRGPRDIFESETVRFHQRVREGYLALAAPDPDGWLVMDGSEKRADLAARIWERIQPLLRPGGADA